MKTRFRAYPRTKGGTYYIEDTITREQKSMFTKDKQEAEAILFARNQAAAQPTLNVAMAKAYLKGKLGDPKSLHRLALKAFGYERWIKDDIKSLYKTMPDAQQRYGEAIGKIEYERERILKALSKQQADQYFAPAEKKQAPTPFGASTHNQRVCPLKFDLIDS